MSESQEDTEHAFTHMLTVFSVAAGMIGVCLTAIGLDKIVICGVFAWNLI